MNSDLWHEESQSGGSYPCFVDIQWKQNISVELKNLPTVIFLTSYGFLGPIAFVLRLLLLARQPSSWFKTWTLNVTLNLSCMNGSG